MPSNETLLFILFNVFILAMLALDLGVFHRRPHEVSVKEAAIWSTVWVTLSLLFNIGLFFTLKESTGDTQEATRVGLEFLTGYLLEKALSVDNIFVFIVLFSYFGVPRQFQHKVLFWGVIGALVLRSVFIAAGAMLIYRFEWILYIFGVILVVSGAKMMQQGEMEVHPDRNIFIRLARRFFPVTTSFSSGRFIIKENGRQHLTPLFLVLIAVETTDVVFAVDSIPAVFGITRDPFIVYSSNVFAILGLRAMYFLLSGLMSSFYYLKHGLSLVLIFIGVKMLIADFLHVPVGTSLGVVGGVLVVTVTMSLIRTRRLQRRPR
jgi:tellurite resistance protein TerC